MNEEREERRGTGWKSCSLFCSSRRVSGHICGRFRDISRGNLLEIFLLPRFPPYRLTRNFYPLIFPSKRRRKVCKEREGGKPVFEEEFSRRNSFWKRLFNAHPERRNCFAMGLFQSWISLIASTFFFFSCFSLPREKRKNESIEANLFERKYRFVKILISNHLFVLVILCLFISIVDEYSSGIDLLHKKMLLNIFDLFLEISES